VKAPWQRVMLAGVALILVGAATTAQSLRFPGRIGASTPEVAGPPSTLPPLPRSLPPCGKDARGAKIPLDATVNGHTLTFYEIGSCFVRTSNGVRWTIADTAPRVPTSVNESAGTDGGRVTLSSGCDDTLGSAGETLPIAVGSAISFEAQVRTGSAICDISVGSGALPAAVHKSRKRASGLSHLAMIAIASAIVLGAAAVFIARRRGWSVLSVSRSRSGDDDSDDELEETPDVYGDVDEALEEGLARALAVLDETVDPRTAVVTSWVQLEVALRDAKLVRRPAATSREFASEVLTSLQLDAVAIERLQRLYLDARYSQREITAEMREEARDLVAALIVELRDRAGLVTA
jgi:hypothetical protein